MIKLNYTIKALSTFLLIATLSSCLMFKGTNSITEPAEVISNTISEVKDTLSEIDFFITECDTIRRSNKFGYENIRFQTTTFSAKTNIYCSPRENSELLDAISVNTEVRGRRIVTFNNIIWLEIFYESGLGYIKRDDTRSGVIENYHVLVIEGQTNEGKQALKLFKKYDYNQTKDEFVFSEVNKFRTTTLLKTCRLSNLEYLIKSESQIDSFNFHIKSIEFIGIDNKYENLHGIISYNPELDWSDSVYTKECIYLPCVFPNGKILFLENGDIENAFNKKSGEIKSFELNKKTKISNSELVIKTKKIFNQKLDENGEPMYDDEADPILILKKELATYYQWDGIKLVEIK